MTVTDPQPQAHALFALDPAAIACPHAVFERLRAEGPVTWIPEIEAYAVTRYDDIVAVNRAPERFSNRIATGPVLARQLESIVGQLVAEDPEMLDLLTVRVGRGRAAVLLSADPPEHGRQRSLVNRSFALRRVRAMEDDIVAITDELLDGFPADGAVEIVRDYAVPLPLTVIANALGVPTSGMADFKRWSDDFVVAIGNHNLTTAEMAAMLRSQAEFFDYFSGEIADRREHPRDDLVTEVVQSRLDGEELTEPEMLSMFSQFLVAGNETTTKLIASALLHLARDAALADSLRADPERVAPFIEEVLRLDAPVQGLFRVANTDSVVGGVEIPAGAALWLVYASGNRDPERWSEPDECQLARSSALPHLAFGNGEHFCLGASLARAEGRIAIQRLLGRYSGIALAEPEAELAYEPSYVLHGLHELRLSLTR